MSVKVILITGTPCVGKTTISKTLATKINAVHIDVAELVKRERLYSKIDKERNSLIADLDKVSKRIGEMIKKSEKNIIIDGHYAVHIVNPEDVNFVFVLRKDPENLKTLMEKRGYAGRKLWENLEAEILDVCLLEAIEICGKNKVCEIDTTDKSIDEIVNEIVDIIAGKGRCNIGIVDWISKLEEKGILDSFLKNLP
ncbi:kinase [Candidatus Bathyarchaeota archaeon]|nr:MAG: kinase [Candidatus Bathyarchaeota archaeon]